MRNIPDLWNAEPVKPALSDLVRFRDQPHRFLLDLARDNGDVVWYGAGALKFVLGSSPDHVKHVLIDGQRVYTKRTFQYGFLSEVTGDGLLTSDGETWRVRRRIQQPAFRRDRLALVAAATRRSTQKMLDAWSADGRETVNIADEMFALSLDVVMDVLFGYDIGVRAPEIVEATLGVLHYLIKKSRSLPGLPSWLSPMQRRDYRKARAVLDGVIDTILARHQPGAAEHATLLDLLMEAQDDDRITPAGVRNEMMTMIIAGHETVASGLTWAWRLLGDAPEVAERLATEARGGADGALGLPLARNVISEALRLYPPAWIVTRRAEPDIGSGVSANGWLPPNTLVMLSPYVTHRLERFWERPNEFDPSRFDRPVAPNSYFPFGAGQRLCIGKDFALVEAAIVLSEVSSRYRLQPLTPDDVEYAGVTLQPEGGIEVRLSAA